MKNVFNIIDVMLNKEDIWLVKGRAYEDLRLHDTVFVEVSDPLDAISNIRFEVVGISLYGKEVSEINRMLTGELLLQGPQGEQLSKTNFLLKLS
jgi:hypothetical protein